MSCPTTLKNCFSQFMFVHQRSNQGMLIVLHSDEEYEEEKPEKTKKKQNKSKADKGEDTKQTEQALDDGNGDASEMN